MSCSALERCCGSFFGAGGRKALVAQGCYGHGSRSFAPNSALYPPVESGLNSNRFPHAADSSMCSREEGAS